MSLYEPCAFHLLPECGTNGRDLLEEIGSVGNDIGFNLAAGAYADAACRFIDYWNGPGAWNAMKPTQRCAMLRYAPKMTLEFRALVHERAYLADYRTLTCPTLLMHGERAPAPTVAIARHLAATVPGADLKEIANAGHMGPLSHADLVQSLIADHLLTAVDNGGSALTSANAMSLGWLPSK